MNYLGILSSQFLVTVTIAILLCDSSFSGDPCPSKQLLAPCTCSQVSIVQRKPEIQNTMAVDVITPIPESIKRSVMLPVQEKESSMPLPLLSVSTETINDSNNSFYTVVSCVGPKSISLLEEAVSNGLHRKWVDKLILVNVPAKKEHTLARLPSGWLKTLRVTQFEIRNTILAGDFIFSGNPFEGQGQNLLWFTATNCYLSGSLTYDTVGTTNTKGLNLLSRVEGVDFSRNHLVYITNVAFRYPPANLSVVNLSYNSIQGIEGSTFHYAPKLHTIDLSHNLLESIQRAIFAAPARNLSNLDLSWNSLTTLPADFFNSMPALSMVNLKSNYLFALSEKPWAVVWRQLKFVQLTGNFLECDCELLWLLNILSPPEVNVTTTPAPKPLAGQTILGSCGHTEPQLYKFPYKLTTLTRKNLNCDA